MNRHNHEAARVRGSVTRVKVCGITSPADARMVEEAGAHAIGIIFASGSKRRVSPEVAAEIVAAVGPFTLKVGVFLDAELATVLRLARELRLDAVQLHGNEPASFAHKVGEVTRVVRAVAYRPGLAPAQLAPYEADAVLLDAAIPGSGTSFAWEQARREWAGNRRLVLAGGLTPENVASAVMTLRPYAVDVATGVEAAPGVKDPEAVAAFVAAVANANAAQ